MDAKTPIAETKPQLLPVGIHFGLPAELHHQDPGLGSTGLRMLRRNPTSYWKNSHLNPDRKEKRTRALDRGQAMHRLIFDGETAFDAMFMRGANNTDDMTPAEKSAATKAANAKAASLGKVVLLAEDYDRIIIAHTIIKKNPGMATAFTNGFPEVSVFWERDGVRRKARIDYLKILGLNDLKGVENKRDIDFEERCRLEVAWRGYHIQMAHYWEARTLIPEFLADGAVHGDHDASLLKKIAAKKDFGWAWVFYCTEGTEDAFAYKVVSENRPFIEVAQRDVELAVARYVRFLKQFGDEQWVLIKPPQDLMLEMMPYNFARMSPEEQGEYENWMRSKK